MHENILEKLVENSRKAIDSGVYEIDEDISEMQSDFDLKEAMLQDKHPTLICEIKYASPSAGRIREDKDAAIIAQEMIKGGASALSVLTQPHMFSGSPEILMRVRKSVNVPILMKDIIIDTVQIDAGKKMGAEAPPLIISCAIIAASLSSLIRPAEGDAYFISHMSVGCLSCSIASFKSKSDCISEISSSISYTPESMALREFSTSFSSMFSCIFTNLL